MRRDFDFMESDLQPLSGSPSSRWNRAVGFVSRRKHARHWRFRLYCRPVPVWLRASKPDYLATLRFAHEI